MFPHIAGEDRFLTTNLLALYNYDVVIAFASNQNRMIRRYYK